MVWKARREKLGREHPDTLASIFEIAVILHREGLFTESEKLNRLVLEGRRKVFSREHPSTLASLNLASALQEQGQTSGKESHQILLFPSGLGSAQPLSNMIADGISSQEEDKAVKCKTKRIFRNFWRWITHKVH